jgi:hypothetical protein
MGYLKTIQEAHEEIEHLRPFNAGTLTANWETLDGYINVPGETTQYVVRSYGVEVGRYSVAYPKGIAVIHPDAYTHSKTTSKHANITKRALEWVLSR